MQVWYSDAAPIPSLFYPPTQGRIPMNGKDFRKLINAEAAKAEYTPVAFLLRSGYAGFGYYNSSVNEGFADMAVFLNVRLIALDRSAQRSGASIRDFSEFLEEVVAEELDREEKDEAPAKPHFGKPIPITAVPLDELAVLYPVAQIGALLRRRSQQDRSVPTFFDLRKSEILSLLRGRIW
jgi:hypothetical protein